MDQIKIGKFIRELRTELGIKQRELAEKLMISDKTISKWETGKGLPEVELMLPLCNILGITVNELLSGEKIKNEEIKSKADENLIAILERQKQGKKKLIMSIFVILMTIISVLTILLVVVLVSIPTWAKITLILISLLVLFTGIFIGGDLDRESSIYTCSHCGKEFVPSFREYLNAMHTIKYRRLRCPHCCEKHWCKCTRVSEESEEKQ